MEGKNLLIIVNYTAIMERFTLQGSTFVGFDIHKRQPNLSRTLQADLSKRVQWVHGNLCVSKLYDNLLVLELLIHYISLEPLPFADGEFDLARMQNIGLGVPEDEVGILMGYHR